MTKGLKNSLLCFLCCNLIGVNAGAAAAESLDKTKGYQLSPLESYLVETLAWEQIAGFVNSGSSTLFENPKVYYLRAGLFAADIKNNLKKTSEQYLNHFAVIHSQVAQVINSGKEFVFNVKNPELKIRLVMSPEANANILSSIMPGHRAGFYCMVSQIKGSSVLMNNCIPVVQFQEQKSKEIANGINTFFVGSYCD